ncbi:MAG: PHP domain-containing protein, partial [Deinococcota bacterium]|nr:PHP domain-containing protein [Deinococcota bacterium]
MTRLTALLNTHSFFSFGMGASSPAKLVGQAAALGYTTVALTDTLGVYGAVELIRAAEQHGLKAVIGATLPLTHNGKTYPLVLLASSKEGYRTLNDLITLAKQGSATVTLSMLEAHNQDLHCLTGGRQGFPNQLIAHKNITEAVYLLGALKLAFKDRLWLQLFHDCYPW